MQEVLVACREGRDPQVGDVMRQVLLRMRGLAALEFGVPWQDREPRLRRVAEHADRRPCIVEEQPRPLLVVGEHLRNPVRPARGEPCREPRLERLHRAARLEPGNALSERYAQHRRPRSLVRRLDLAGRLDVLANPVLDRRTIHRQ